ncbi:MAG: acyltransferase family protein [Brevundimonas sp.]|uniref:acyltransferase family protein n=1 Tax=Brevundimonas sp. TaxID=1871086 RepID=UPI00391B907D
MKGQTFTTMDGLRGVAALMVAAYHTPATYGLMPGGYLAVDLFFALSGFVLAHSSLEKLSSLRAGVPFLVKRIVRLYPLYLVGLALGFLAYLYAAIIEGNLWPTALIVNLMLNGVFLPAPQHYALNSWSAFALNGPAWSLSFEMFVNIILALTAFLYTPRRLAMVLGLSSAALVAVAFFHGDLDVGSSISTFPLGAARVMFSFFVGIAIYRAWAAGKLERVIPWWLSISVLAVLIFLPVPAGYRVVSDPLIVMLAFPVLLASSTGITPLPLLQFLGRISYGVYIVHVPVLALLLVASADFLGQDFASFGLMGTWTVLALVVALAALLNPVDAAARRWLTSAIARSPWRAVFSENHVELSAKSQRSP